MVFPKHIEIRHHHYSYFLHMGAVISISGDSRVVVLGCILLDTLIEIYPRSDTVDGKESDVMKKGRKQKGHDEGGDPRPFIGTGTNPNLLISLLYAACSLPNVHLQSPRAPSSKSITIYCPATATVLVARAPPFGQRASSSERWDAQARIQP